MLQSKFKKIFQSRTGQLENQKILQVPYEPGDVIEGDLFNNSSTTTSLLCFISLSCLDCIDLLPQLQEVTDQYSGNFSLFVEASNEEIDEIKSHFKFEFPLFSLKREDLPLKYRVFTTPYAYLIDSNKCVIKGQNVYNSSDLLELGQVKAFSND